MVPVYIFVAILKYTHILDHISHFFEPLMGYFGLPGSTALAAVTGMFVNLYAALAITAGLDLTARQITILAIILGVCHSQILETAIIFKMKARPILIGIFRFVFSLLVGLALNLLMPV